MKYVPQEERAGEVIVQRLLEGNRGHYGPLEHPMISFAVGYFPHSVVQQARTHRHATFDVQSFRYSGQQLVNVYDSLGDVEEVFYLRPAGTYTNRQGKRYEYTIEERNDDRAYLQNVLAYYALKFKSGMAEEHARGLIAFDVRQHFVVSFNARSLMHFFDLRSKKDAQPEIVTLCDMMYPHFEQWMPAVAGWYRKNRYGKALLAP